MQTLIEVQDGIATTIKQIKSVVKRWHATAEYQERECEEVIYRITKEQAILLFCPHNRALSNYHQSNLVMYKLNMYAALNATTGFPSKEDFINDPQYKYVWDYIGLILHEGECWMAGATIKPDWYGNIDGER